MASDSNNLQLIVLKDTIKQLNITIKNLNEMLVASSIREKEHEQREQILQEQIDYLTKKLFGKSREKRIDDYDGQMSLFDEEELIGEAESFPIECEVVIVEKHTRKKKSTAANKFANLPVQKVYLDISDREKICDIFGTPLEKIGEEFVRREIEIIKPEIKVIEYYSLNYGCPNCKINAEVPNIVKGKDNKPHMLRVRRYLVDAIPKGKEYDYNQPAVQGLVYLDKLFGLER